MVDFGNQTMTVDKDNLWDFIENKLPGILLDNTTDFSIAAACLQFCIDGYKKGKENNN